MLTDRLYMDNVSLSGKKSKLFTACTFKDICQEIRVYYAIPNENQSYIVLY